MTVGQECGAYEGLAKDPQVLLAQSGIKLELRTTRGAREDLDLLNDPNSGVTLAVVQGGVVMEADGNDLMSLASLYQEPVWVFYQQGLKLDSLDATGLPKWQCNKSLIASWAPSWWWGRRIPT